MTFARSLKIFAFVPFCAVVAFSTPAAAEIASNRTFSLAATLNNVEPAAGNKDKKSTADKKVKKTKKSKAAKKTAAEEKAKTERRRGHMPDPLEPVNRAVFGLNDLLDKVLIGPISTVYNTVVPSFVRQGIQNTMRNLRAPITAANSLLQGDVKNAGVTTARFVINSTVGLGGVFDVAKSQGLPYRGEDFGQTLGRWGVTPGAYIVLPVIGPTTLRDGIGMAADSQADPLRIWSFKTGHDWIYYTRNGVEALDTRARLDRGIKDLRANSLDYYAAVRSAYAQKRESETRNEDTGAARIPDYRVDQN